WGDDDPIEEVRERSRQLAGAKGRAEHPVSVKEKADDPTGQNGHQKRVRLPGKTHHGRITSRPESPRGVGGERPYHDMNGARMCARWALARDLPKDLAQKPFTPPLRARAVAYVFDALHKAVDEQTPAFEVELFDVKTVAADDHHSLIGLEQHLLVVKTLDVDHTLDAHRLPVLEGELMAFSHRRPLGARRPLVDPVQRASLHRDR